MKRRIMKSAAMLLVVLVCCLVARVPAASIENRLAELEKQMQLRLQNETRLEAEVVNVQNEVDQLKSQIEEKAVSVAFSTRLHEDTIITDGPVVFGTVDLNIGDAYDEFSGAFRPPIDGMYLLTVYAVVYTTNIQSSIYIKRNDDILCQGYLFDNSNMDASTATCSAVATLAVGDTVRVTGTSERTNTIRASYSGFLGHIVVD